VFGCGCAVLIELAVADRCELVIAAAEVEG